MRNIRNPELSRRKVMGSFFAGASAISLATCLSPARAAEAMDDPPPRPRNQRDVPADPPDSPAAHVPTAPPTGPAPGAAGGLPAEFLKDKLPPSSYAKRLFDKVLRRSDYQGATVLLLSSFSVECQNAYATCVPSSVAMPTPEGVQRASLPVICYNPAFMSQISFSTDNEYVPAYVLAHELGHIAHRHVDPNNPVALMEHPWKQELEADWYAGKVMARLKAKPEDLELAHRLMVSSRWLRFERDGDNVVVVMADKRMRVESLMVGGSTHPDALKRIQAISMGYREGGGEGNIETNLTTIFGRIAEEAIRWDPGT